LSYIIEEGIRIYGLGEVKEGYRLSKIEGFPLVLKFYSRGLTKQYFQDHTYIYSDKCAIIPPYNPQSLGVQVVIVDTFKLILLLSNS
jgi:hypothetical protein